MRRIQGGAFSMGSARFYPEERPVRMVRAESFWIDETPVTNDAFARFVEESGYVTLAERTRSTGRHREASAPTPAGSAVFERPASPSITTGPGSWWHFREEACWRRPLGAGSDLEGLGDHPVVHVAYEDAAAYAVWSGKRLPTEIEWEFAARGGLEGAEYAWGNQLAPEGLMLANFWQGDFPSENTLLDGWERTSPVRSFPANGYGLHDMIGNVWEWTSDWWSLPSETSKATRSCCGSRKAQGEAETDGDHRAGAMTVPRKVLKGGSHLCAQNYCQRYRPAARHPQPIDAPAGHIGFRCAAG